MRPSLERQQIMSNPIESSSEIQHPTQLCDGTCGSCSVPFVDERDNGEPVSCAYCGEELDLKGAGVSARRTILPSAPRG